MGCVGVGSDRNTALGRRPLDNQDLLNRKRQMLVEYSLRNKISCIIDIVNSKIPF